MTAEHPGRVQRLVLYGSFAHGPGIADDRAREAIVSVVRSHWGVGWRLLTGVFFPDGDAEDLRWFARFQRDSATPEMAAALLEGIYRTEAREAFKRVSAPTLVLHRRDDRAIPFQLGVEWPRWFRERASSRSPDRSTCRGAATSRRCSPPCRTSWRLVNTRSRRRLIPRSSSPPAMPSARARSRCCGLSRRG